MQVAPPVGTNSGGITWWSNFELIQVEPLYLAGEITQVKEAIPWFRCASGNVSSFVSVFVNVFVFVFVTSIYDGRYGLLLGNFII